MENKDNVINKYYTGHIGIGDGKWLTISRVESCEGVGEGIQLSLIDKETQSTMFLGELFHGRWYTPNFTNANVLWTLLKQHQRSVQRIVYNLKTPVSKPFQVEWQCLKRRFRLESIKVKRKLIK